MKNSVIGSRFREVVRCFGPSKSGVGRQELVAYNFNLKVLIPRPSSGILPSKAMKFSGVERPAW
jgi:hypothetical protein